MGRKLGKHGRKTEKTGKTKESRISNKLIIIGWIVSLIGVGLIAPYMHAWFAELIRPKPNVYFVREKCAIVPTGTNVILVKLVIKNKGQTEESSLELRVKVSSPYVFLNTTQDYWGTEMATLSGGEAAMHVIPVENPNVEVIQHGFIEVDAQVVGIKVWDAYTFSESW